MANPFYTQQGNNQNGSSNNLSEIYKLLTNSNNPMQIFNNIAKNNPRMAPVLNLLNKGYTPEQVFTSMCQMRGINPQDFIKNITK